jgi:S1-C subfamily serine protease
MAWAGGALAWSVALPARVTLTRLPAGLSTRPVVFSRLAVRIPQGQVFAKVGAGGSCTPQPDKKWTGADTPGRPSAAFRQIFDKELTAAGFRPAQDTSNLFDDTASSIAEYEVGAAITDLHEEFCGQAHAWRGGIGVKGAARIGVEWQIYSRLQGRVVAKVTTTGGSEQNSFTDTATADVLNDAFDQNVIALLSSRDFVAALSEAPVGGPPTPAGPAQAPIPIAVAYAPSSVPDSVGSVVSIFAGDGFGSGWVVSDGYLMTDRHVVGQAGAVRIRWSDQVETQGVVVRTDPRRDVALIQTDTRGRRPLPVRFDALRPGDTVYAIGTPLDPQLQSSVTRGVVSGVRTIDGLGFVQSDVTVNHGDSGGPLLDEQGRVVGLAALGLQPNGAPAGVNLFIPIQDAFDFLQLQVRWRQPGGRPEYVAADPYARPAPGRPYVSAQDGYDGGYARSGQDQGRAYDPADSVYPRPPRSPVYYPTEDAPDAGYARPARARPGPDCPRVDEAGDGYAPPPVSQGRASYRPADVYDGGYGRPAQSARQPYYRPPPAPSGGDVRSPAPPYGPPSPPPRVASGAPALDPDRASIVGDQSYIIQ